MTPRSFQYLGTWTIITRRTPVQDVCATPSHYLVEKMSKGRLILSRGFVRQSWLGNALDAQQFAGAHEEDAFDRAIVQVIALLADMIESRDQNSSEQ